MAVVLHNRILSSPYYTSVYVNTSIWPCLLSFSLFFFMVKGDKTCTKLIPLNAIFRMRKRTQKRIRKILDYLIYLSEIYKQFLVWIDSNYIYQRKRKYVNVSYTELCLCTIYKLSTYISFIILKQETQLKNVYVCVYVRFGILKLFCT